MVLELKDSVRSCCLCDSAWVVSIVLSPLFICFDENANSNRGWMGSFPLVHGFCVGLGFDLNCFCGGMDGNWRWSCAIKVFT